RSPKFFFGHCSLRTLVHFLISATSEFKYILIVIEWRTQRFDQPRSQTPAVNFRQLHCSLFYFRNNRQLYPSGNIIPPTLSRLGRSTFKTIVPLALASRRSRLWSFSDRRRIRL